MAIVPTRAWPLVTAGSSGFISSTNTAVPAAAGSGLVAVVAVRPTTTPGPNPPVTVTDSHGGTWDISPLAGSESSSTRLAVAVRTAPAGGVTSVTATVPGTSQIHLHVYEFAGVPSSLKIGASNPGVSADATTYPARTVEAPAGALVVGAGSTGVTNRTLILQGTGFVEIGNHKASGVHSVSAFRVVGASPETTGPAWDLAAGNSSTTLVQLTATIVQGEGPQPLAVDVGADRTINVDAPVQLSASATGGTGTKTFAWTIVSGPSGGGTFVDPTAPNATFDPGSTPGVYELRCTVTDGSGTASDTLTLTVLRTLTYLPFAAVNASTGWAPTGGTVLDVLSDSDDATLITSSENPTNQILDVRLPPMSVPDQPVQLRLRARALNAGSASVVARLYTGATLRATSDPVSIYDTFGQVDVTFPLSALAAISPADWEAGVRATFSVTAA
ncbi:hypothetical protein SAMN05216184_10483 [Georgenia satyanarayanai]|uniref:PKD domain-containing protein n=1 Tax=Georgenia satyanarayanai TaxID=860221 RepID=A0A2Y9A7C7_9MICO|nr:hypothetical protein [Georgenia satyanarayanai]PYG00144.1 hypothetical protein A8987_10483 [Georgenia satyanarayanai]SSA40344.1 hypothetical protein SAMN05216184_10483 [Georgenia satyanarayanai]